MYKKFISQKKGVATIEFALLFLPLMLFLAFFLEILILLYQNSLLNFVTNEAAKYSSNYDKKLSYEDKFNLYLKKQNNFFLKFANIKNLQTNLKKCKNMEELNSDTCNSSDENATIISYSLSYKVEPIFTGLRFSKNEKYITNTVIFPLEKIE